MMRQGYFITGTDTDAGKTWATVALMQSFRRQGRTVAGMKPVASGCRRVEGKLYNDDALRLQDYANVELAYDLVNPYAYAAPVSPHLAGRDDPADFEAILACFAQIRRQAEVVLVEGAGGWHAPLNDEQDVCDLARAFGLPVILAVGIKLGCINHAKLTANAIVNSGLAFAGWIAVCNDPAMTHVDENIATLERALPAPLLGTLPYRASGEMSDLHRFIRPNAFGRKIF